MSCLTNTETPTTWKKLTIWWPDSHQDIIRHRSKHWSQEIELMEWRLFVFKAIKMTDQNTTDQNTTNLKKLSELTILFLHVAPPSAYESSCSLIVSYWREEESALDRHLPTLWLSASKLNKLSFSTKWPLSIFFGWWTGRTHIQLQCQPVKRIGEHLLFFLLGSGLKVTYVMSASISVDLSWATFDSQEPRKFIP